MRSRAVTVRADTRRRRLCRALTPLRDFASHSDEGEYEHEPHADDRYFSARRGFQDVSEDMAARGAPITRPFPAPSRLS